MRFWVALMEGDGTTSETGYMLYKKVSWPRVPRQGDMFELDGEFAIVGKTWHARDKSRKPNFWVEMHAHKQAFEECIRKKGWLTESPFP